MDDLKTTLTNIADAIRYKLSANDLIAPVDFALNILSIPVEGGGYSDPTPIIDGTVKTVSNTASFTRSAAFAYCYNLTTAHLSLCETVGGETFANCSKLKAVNLDKCKTINESAFLNCGKLSKISIPLCETIDPSAFMSAGLQSIILPECEYIGYYAFYRCGSLTTAYLPKVTQIGDYTFYQCYSLSDLYLPVCTQIGMNAFYDCKVSNIDLPSCHTVNTGAFMYCNAKSLSLPKLTTAYEAAFKWAYNNDAPDTELSLPSLTHAYSEAFYGNGFSYLYAPALTYAGRSAFAANNFSEILLPQVREIGIEAFSKYDYQTPLVRISIPKCSVLYGSSNTAVGPFYSNTSEIREVYAPELRSIGNGVFYFCSNLSSFTVDYAKIQNVGFGAFENCSRIPEFTNLSLPRVSRIDTLAFIGCSQIQTAYVPVCYSLCGFWGASNLSSIQADFVEYVGISAFTNCGKLTELFFPAPTNLYAYAFDNCVSLSKIVILSPSCSISSTSGTFRNTPFNDSSYLGYFGSIYVPERYSSFYTTSPIWSSISARLAFMPDSADYVYHGEFMQDSTITEIPASKRNAKLILSSAFQSCDNLLSVDLPECTHLYYNAFAYCYSLNSVSLPKVRFINTAAFYRCSSLSTIILPECEFIRDSAFQSCTKLMSLYLLSTSVVGLWSRNYFPLISTPIYSSVWTSSGYKYGSIYVRSSLYSAYLSDPYWSFLSASRFVSLTDEEVATILGNS